MDARDPVGPGQLAMPKLERGGLRQVGAPAGKQGLAKDRADRAALRDRAKQIFETRRRRSQIFGKAMFGEPAWDILLSLYMSEEHGTTQNAASLARLADAPQTTVFRWLDYLETRGWVERDRFNTDRRLVVVELTDAARDAFEKFLSETPDKD